MLELLNVTKTFGGLQATNQLSFCVNPGEIVSLIGPNGAGKTTVLNLISGLYQPTSGDIRFEGRSIVGLTPAAINRRGIARTFQSLRLFLNMSVRDNVMAAAYAHTHTSLWQIALRTPKFRREEQRIRQLAEEKLAFFGTRLQGYRHDAPAYSLSYANRRRLEIARAMATEPRLLLLDEPAAGMNPHETAELTALIGELRTHGGYTILLIEHDMGLVERISDRVIALDHGAKIAEGSFADVATNAHVVEAYLGRRATGDEPAKTGIQGDDGPRDTGYGIQDTAYGIQTTPLLRLENINTHYGPIHILQDVNITVSPGEIVCLLGGNASGKSTTLKTILGMVRPTSGGVWFAGEPVQQRSTSDRIARGMAVVPENRRIFGTMTVRENLLIGAYLRQDQAEINANLDRVFALFPRLHERQHQTGGTLSGGEQQMLAFGRALMSNPRLILMDEPSMGLAPQLVEQNFAIIQQINRQGVTIFMVEQNANMALSIAHRGYVLQTGRVVLHDNAANLLNNEHLRRAYLGR